MSLTTAGEVQEVVINLGTVISLNTDFMISINT